MTIKQLMQKFRLAYLGPNEIDYTRYDACVRQSLCPTPTATSVFLNMISKEWHILVKGNYEAVMPLHPQRVMGFDTLYQPTFSQQLGIFSPYKLSNRVIEAFLLSMPSRYRYVHIHLNHTNLFESVHLNTSIHTNYQINLDKPYEETFSGYDDAFVDGMRSAARATSRVVKHDDPNVLLRLLEQKISKRMLSNKFPVQLFKNVVTHATHRGIGSVWSLYDQTNTIVASTLLLTNSSRVVALFTLGDDHVRKLSSYTGLLLDKVIREYAEKYSVFDFASGSESSISAVCRQMGADVVPYYKFVRNTLPFPFSFMF